MYLTHLWWLHTLSSFSPATTGAMILEHCSSVSVNSGNEYNRILRIVVFSDTHALCLFKWSVWILYYFHSSAFFLKWVTMFELFPSNAFVNPNLRTYEYELWVLVSYGTVRWYRSFMDDHWKKNMDVMYECRYVRTYVHRYDEWLIIIWSILTSVRYR